MYRIVKEAVANSMKHSGATIIDIRLHRENGRLLFEIADNGKGMKEQTLNDGIGIEAMKRRIESLNGNIDISSTSNGTATRRNFPILTIKNL